VYAQHWCYFNAHGRSVCPRVAFLSDLALFINKLVLQGNEIFAWQILSVRYANPMYLTLQFSVDLKNVFFQDTQPSQPQPP